MDKQSKIVLISGPTASGKSNFAVKIAKKIQGEIINADSMQVYKILKILTARPNKIEQKDIKHHLYGVVDLNKKGVKDDAGQPLKIDGSIGNYPKSKIDPLRGIIFLRRKVFRELENNPQISHLNIKDIYNVKCISIKIRSS